MKRTDTYVALGTLLSFAIGLTYVGLMAWKVDGYRLPVATILMGLMVIGMFLVSVFSRNPAVIRERKWLVLALLLVALTNLAGVFNRLAGVDPTSFGATFVYLPIILTGGGLTIWAAKRRASRR